MRIKSMENQSQPPEKPKKSVWKKWWFWLIIIVIILVGSIVIFDHTLKVNYCKKLCVYLPTVRWIGVWSYNYPSDKYSLYSTRQECIEACLLNIDWGKVEY